MEKLEKEKFEVYIELDLTKCVLCGKSIKRASVGRPKKYCEQCFKKHRKKYQHKRYLKKKYPNLAYDEIKLKELDEQLKRTENQIQRHKRWLNHYLKQRPYLRLIFSNKGWSQRERILKPIRRCDKEFYYWYYKKGIAREIRNLGGSGYCEPLWKPSRKNKQKSEESVLWRKWLASVIDETERS